MDEKVKYLRAHYPQYSDKEIQSLIESANRFEEQRRLFVMSIPRKQTKKQIKTAVRIKNVLVFIP